MPRDGGVAVRLHIALMAPALLAGLLSHTPAFAQNEYEEFVEEQIEELCDYIWCEFLDHVDYFIGSAAEGSSNSHSVEITAGEEYIVYAVCDQDCDDVDIFFYDPSGSLVANDSSAQAHDDFPTASAEFEFEATSSGTYRLEVKIYGCSTSTCYYAAEVDVW